MPKVGGKKKRTKKKAGASVGAKPPTPPAEGSRHIASPERLAWRRISRQQLAALMGVHPDTVTDYVRNGMPTVTAGGRGRESEYDAVDCLEWWRSKQGKNAKDAAQTRAYEATAKLNELKLARERAELLPREQVVREGQVFVKGWTAKLRTLPRRLVSLGVIQSDQEATTTTLIRELLTEIAGWKTAADVEKELAAAS